MRRSLKGALLWMMPVGLLSACGGAPDATGAEDALGASAQSLISAPPVPASGDVADSMMHVGTVAVGGAQQDGTSFLPGYYGYRVQVQAGSQLKLEVTHLGSSMYLDTGLFLYGPKDANGSFGSTVLAQDDDSGYGQLSKVGLVTLPQGGEYLAVVGFTDGSGKQFRLQVDCVGGACVTNPQPAPAGHALTLIQSPITASLQATLDAGNTVREDSISYLTAYDFAWPYSGETTLDAAVTAILAQSQYRGYRNDPSPDVMTYTQLQPYMYWQFQPLHPAILATYGNGTEDVQVKLYSREFSTGPNGDNWRTLSIILFPRSYKVVVYEQTAYEL